jgi:predicted PurR-regulated permease PerM
MFLARIRHYARERQSSESAMTYGESTSRRPVADGASLLARTAIATATVIAVLAVAVGLWYARTAILLAFAGLLLAIVLYGGSRALAELTRLPRLAALAIVVLGAVTFFVLVLWGAGPTLGQQVAQLAHSLAAGATSLTKQLASFADQNSLFENIDLVQLLGKFLSPWGIATSATSVALSIVGVFSAGLIVLFFGIYFAADPHTYVTLATRLAPAGRRVSAMQMLHQTGDLLRRWLVGQGIAMALIGGFTYVGLLILGVPIPFVLALFAGLAGFLPYLGPIIGAIPIVLVAGGESLDLALWVVGLYAVIQFLESYLLTPLIQARAVSLPPAVVILAQLVLGAVFGILGLALATPLAAAAVVPLRYLFGAREDELAAMEPAGAKPRARARMAPG